MYQPIISDDNVRKLYRMKLKEKKPMTRLINQILDDFFQTYEQHNPDERREMTWTIPDQGTGFGGGYASFLILDPGRKEEAVDGGG